MVLVGVTLRRWQRAKQVPSMLVLVNGRKAITVVMLTPLILWAVGRMVRMAGTVCSSAYYRPPTFAKAIEDVSANLRVHSAPIKMKPSNQVAKHVYQTPIKIKSANQRAKHVQVAPIKI